MNTRHIFILGSLLLTILISACTPATSAKPAPAAAQANPPSAPTSAPAPASTVEPKLGPDPKLMVAWDATANASIAQTATAAPPTKKNTKTIAGLWAGTMDFSNDPAHTEDIEVQIDPDCVVNSACGFVNNLTVHCRWELTYRGTQADAFLLEHTKTLSGDCPASGVGQYTLLASGKLERKHVTPDFTASGVMTRK